VCGCVDLHRRQHEQLAMHDGVLAAAPASLHRRGLVTPVVGSCAACVSLALTPAWTATVGATCLCVLPTVCHPDLLTFCIIDQCSTFGMTYPRVTLIPAPGTNTPLCRPGFCMGGQTACVLTAKRQRLSALFCFPRIIHLGTFGLLDSSSLAAQLVYVLSVMPVCAARFVRASVRVQRPVSLWHGPALLSCAL
jgi:hypothetical protein